MRVPKVRLPSRLPIRLQRAARLVVSLVLSMSFFAFEAFGQQTDEETALLRSIQTLESLRYEILLEQARYENSPTPTDEATLKAWRGIGEDMAATLAEIDLALRDYRQQYLELSGQPRIPRPEDMPALLPQ